MVPGIDRKWRIFVLFSRTILLEIAHCSPKENRKPDHRAPARKRGSRGINPDHCSPSLNLILFTEIAEIYLGVRRWTRLAALIPS